MTDPATASKTFRWADPDPIAALLPTLSGLEYMRALRDGTIPYPPMVTLIGGTAVEVEDGRVTVSAVPGQEHRNPIGTVHGGFLCTLLDTAAGCAAHTTLAAGLGYTSIELKVSYLRPVVGDGGRVTATTTVTKRGSRVIFTDGTAWDARGRVVATASSSLLVIPIGNRSRQGHG